MPLSDVGFYDSQTLQKLLGAGGQVLQIKSAYDNAAPDQKAAVAAQGNTARTSAIQSGVDPALLNELFGPGVTQAQANKNFQYLSSLATNALKQETQAKSTTLSAGPTPSVTPGGTPSITPGTAGAGGVTAGALSNVTPTPGGGVSFKVTATGTPPPAGTPTQTFEWNGNQFAQVPVGPIPHSTKPGVYLYPTPGNPTVPTVPSFTPTPEGMSPDLLRAAAAGQAIPPASTLTFTPTNLGSLPPPPGVPFDYMQGLSTMMNQAQNAANIGNLVVPPVDLNSLRTEAQGQVKIETDPQLLALTHQQENLNRTFDQKIAELEPKFALYTESVSKAAAKQRVGAKESMNARGLYFTSLLDDVIGTINENELSSIGAAAADKTSLIKNMAEDLAAASQQLGQQRAQIESSVGLKENLIFAQLKREAEAASRQGALDQFNAKARAAELNMQSIGQNMGNLMTLITNQQSAYQKDLDRQLQTVQAQLDRDLEIWKTNANRFLSC